MGMKCDSCEDWEHQIYVLNGFIQVASARSGQDLFTKAGGKQFKFCPWCGSILTTDGHIPADPTGDANG